MIKYLKLAFLFLVTPFMVKGQDIHFSQFDFVPFHLNPSLGGAIDNENLSYGVIYRDQAFTVSPQSYKSFMAFADSQWKNVFSKNNFAGAGLALLNDETGDGQLRSNKVIINLAYHLSLKDDEQFLSFGGQGAFVNRIYNNFDNLLFEEEINGGVFSENFDAGGQDYFDYNLGISYTNQLDDDHYIRVGSAIHNLNSSDTESVLVQRIPKRYSAFAQYFRALSDEISIKPQAHFQLLDDFKELIVQTQLYYKTNWRSDWLWNIGLGWRMGDAVQLLLGAQYKNWDIGLAYDYNISKLQEATRFVGGLELGIKYRHSRKVRSNPMKKEPEIITELEKKVPQGPMVPLLINIENKDDRDSLTLEIFSGDILISKIGIRESVFKDSIVIEQPYTYVIKSPYYETDTLKIDPLNTTPEIIIKSILLKELVIETDYEIFEFEEIVEVEEIIEEEVMVFEIPIKKPETEKRIYKNVPIRLKNIYFDFDDDKILLPAEKDLYYVLSLLNDYSDMVIELSSHTDSRGDNNYNQSLSQRRANSSKKWLIKKGINPSRIVAKGYGESVLVNNCRDGIPCTKDQHQENRRTEFKILEGPQSIPSR